MGDLVIVYPWMGCDKPDCLNCQSGPKFKGNLRCPEMAANALGVGKPGGYVLLEFLDHLQQ